MEDDHKQPREQLAPDTVSILGSLALKMDTPDVQRRKALAAWLGIEKAVWMKVGNFDKVFAICNEDLERENEYKTSAVHFMRFQLSDDMVAGACKGQPISAGIDLPQYNCNEMPLPDNVQAALRADLKDCSGAI